MVANRETVAQAQTIIQLIEQLAPKSLAMEGDEERIGLQVGTLSKKVRRVMITLDVLESVVEEAISKEIDLIIAHHAVIFRPIRQLITDEPQGRLLQKCLQHGVSIYAAHTNLDVAEGGVNDMLADSLSLQETEVLIPFSSEALKKLVVFIPAGYVETVMQAVADAGGGWIGHYSHCTFQTQGVGTFLPREGTDPYIGEQGKLERVQEVRLETVVPVSLQESVVEAMIAAHPYEEVAYDIYPLELPGKVRGIGRKGKLPQSMKLEQFARFVKDALDVPGLRVVGPRDKTIQTVGVLGGDGNSFVDAAASKAIDVLVTGDVTYHVAHEAQARGLALVDPGHNIEKVMKEGLKKYLLRQLAQHYPDTEVLISEVNTDPFQFM